MPSIALVTRSAADRVASERKRPKRNVAQGGTWPIISSERSGPTRVTLLTIGRVRVVDYKSKGAINKRIYLAVEP